MDNVSEVRLQDVHSQLARLIQQMAEMLALEKINLRVTQGLRSWNEQDKLFQQGRTMSGPVVTKAQPGHSWHNFGLAVDVVPLEPTGPDWNTQHPRWQRVVTVGDSLGLVSGAQFRSFPDYPHFQLTGRFPISPDDEVRQLFKDGGIQAVWAESGLLP